MVMALDPPGCRNLGESGETKRLRPRASPIERRGSELKHTNKILWTHPLQTADPAAPIRIVRAADATVAGARAPRAPEAGARKPFPVPSLHRRSGRRFSAFSGSGKKTSRRQKNRPADQPSPIAPPAPRRASGWREKPRSAAASATRSPAAGSMSAISIMTRPMKT